MKIEQTHPINWGPALSTKLNTWEKIEDKKNGRKDSFFSLISVILREAFKKEFEKNPLQEVIKIEFLILDFLKRNNRLDGGTPLLASWAFVSCRGYRTRQR